MQQDYLKPDSLLSSGLENQKFICVSFLHSEGRKGLIGFKFRGAFATVEEAQSHAKQLSEIDPNYDTYVGEGFKWLPIDPEADPKNVKSVVYYEKELQNIAKNYEENLLQQQKLEQERKANLIKNGHPTSDLIKTTTFEPEKSKETIEKNTKTIDLLDEKLLELQKLYEQTK